MPAHCRLLLESFQRCEALAVEIWLQRVGVGADLEGARQAVYSRCYREFMSYAGNAGWQQLKEEVGEEEARAIRAQQGGKAWQQLKEEVRGEEARAVMGGEGPREADHLSSPHNSNSHY